MAGSLAFNTPPKPLQASSNRGGFSIETVQLVAFLNCTPVARHRVSQPGIC